MREIIILVKTVFSGLESLSYLGPKTWEITPPEIKQVDVLSEFRNKIRLWNSTNCPCRILKKYKDLYKDLIVVKV